VKGPRRRKSVAVDEQTGQILSLQVYTDPEVLDENVVNVSKMTFQAKVDSYMVDSVP